MLLCWYATNVIFLSGAVIADIEFPNNLLLTANPSNDTPRTELFREWKDWCNTLQFNEDESAWVSFTPMMTSSELRNRVNCKLKI